MSDFICCDWCRGTGTIVGEEDRIRCTLCRGTGEYRDPAEICHSAGLYDSTPGCTGRVVPSSGGGVKCIKCKGWFCF
jgi:hypothetical protein